MPIFNDIIALTFGVNTYNDCLPEGQAGHENSRLWLYFSLSASFQALTLLGNIALQKIPSESQPNFWKKMNHPLVYLTALTGIAGSTMLGVGVGSIFSKKAAVLAGLGMEIISLTETLAATYFRPPIPASPWVGPSNSYRRQLDSPLNDQNDQNVPTSPPLASSDFPLSSLSAASLARVTAPPFLAAGALRSDTTSQSYEPPHL